MKIVIPGVLESISTRVDGSMRVSFSTQEIDPSQGSSLLQMRGKYCKVLLSDTNITPIEEKIIDEEIIKDGKRIKSQAQRLRSVLFRMWEQSGLQIDFEDYYKTETERLIDHFKQKLI